jgi:hypothetical protein
MLDDNEGLLLFLIVQVYPKDSKDSNSKGKKTKLRKRFQDH